MSEYNDDVYPKELSKEKENRSPNEHFFLGIGMFIRKSHVTH